LSTSPYTLQAAVFQTCIEYYTPFAGICQYFFAFLLLFLFKVFVLGYLVRLWLFFAWGLSSFDLFCVAVCFLASRS